MPWSGQGCAVSVGNGGGGGRGLRAAGCAGIWAEVSGGSAGRPSGAIAGVARRVLAISGWGPRRRWVRLRWALRATGGSRRA